MNTLIVKKPSNRHGLIGLLLITVLMGILFSGMTTQAQKGFLYYEVGAIFILGIVCGLIMLVQQFRKPKEMRLESTGLRIGTDMLKTDEIDEIRVGGRYDTIIGIKPKGKTIVPSRYCFSFTDHEDEDIIALSKWADANGIPMINRPFIRWN
ncbi:hypothetical protein [Paenibacillus kandeliae]|uniref:hypothetical protein n=1 Tax=Paenibacillus kandeliae TaxID=3231269 RepID=UPI00345A8881